MLQTRRHCPVMARTPEPRVALLGRSWAGRAPPPRRVTPTGPAPRSGSLAAPRRSSPPQPGHRSITVRRPHCEATECAHLVEQWSVQCQGMDQAPETLENETSKILKPQGPMMSLMIHDFRCILIHLHACAYAYPTLSTSLATPMVGKSTVMPRWVAAPQPRGWKAPFPSTRTTWGFKAHGTESMS